MRRQANGFSLVELMVAIGIGAGAILAIASILMTAFTQSSLITDAAVAEIEETRGLNFVQAIFNQALDLRAFGNNDLNFYSGVGGQVRSFDSNTLWASAPTTASATTLAVFWREAGKSLPNPNTAATNSDLRKTVLYFQKPAQSGISGQSTWGVLYGNLGAPGLPLIPTRSEQIFEGFIKLRILNVKTFSRFSSTPAIGDPVTSFDFELTTRRFIGSKPGLRRHFCPDDVANTCGDNAPHRDITRVQRITIRNNVIDQSPSGPHGARLFDLIQFFQPRQPEVLR